MAPPWVLLGRVPRVTAAEPGADPDPDADADADAISLDVALPPRVAILTAARSAHPDPMRPDKYPYIIAAGPGCLLAHFSVGPHYGARLGGDLKDSHLLLLRRFRTAEGVTTASAERVPDRPASMPSLRSLGSAGVVCVDHPADGYVIVDLQVDKGCDSAKLFRIHSGQDQWVETEVRYPLAELDRKWVADGVVALHGQCMWYDLSCGILCCDPFIVGPELSFRSFPEDRVLNSEEEVQRCVTISCDLLRFVEMVSEGGGSPTVSIWTWSPVGWEFTYKEGFEQIWKDNSYKRTWLPEDLPALVAVCPSNAEIIYFSLEEYVFGVHMKSHEVLECERHDMVTLPWPSSASFQYVLAWQLPSAIQLGPPVKERADDFLDGVAYDYAKFCRDRKASLQGKKKDYELCHICYFGRGKALTFTKDMMLDHCTKVHRTAGYQCEKKGCVIRTATLGDAGLHNHFCHMKQPKDWWRRCLGECNP